MANCCSQTEGRSRRFFQCTNIHTHTEREKIKRENQDPKSHRATNLFLGYSVMMSLLLVLALDLHQLLLSLLFLDPLHLLWWHVLFCRLDTFPQSVQRCSVK